MSIALVAIRDNQLCLAADTLSSWGSHLMSAEYNGTASKIIDTADSHIATTGMSVLADALNAIISDDPELLKLDSQLNVFKSWNALHQRLNENYHLRQQGDEDEVESSHFSAIVANKSGAYIVAPLRSVDKLAKFWAIGSGSDYAFGAMHLAYSQGLTPREICEAGVAAAAEFDDGCGAPFEFRELTLQDSQ
ncbi:hypothetical protein [Persicirhabdus sediminis]|uniref:ATP-dependent protease HslVU (ClpYQ), peptidase subunit n=1 Tax=Persicirhabdus sediminis TaxID=454144 RepID=A0A8J7SMD3_9BACT|nr:hypothetical protein [Persicirhabdus sediminis]MBK1791028.1 hypothetical protein [Persicirhabdus sediminis]